MFKSLFTLRNSLILCLLTFSLCPVLVAQTTNMIVFGKTDQIGTVSVNLAPLSKNLTDHVEDLQLTIIIKDNLKDATFIKTDLKTNYSATVLSIKDIGFNVDEPVWEIALRFNADPLVCYFTINVKLKRFFMCYVSEKDYLIYTSGKLKWTDMTPLPNVESFLGSIQFLDIPTITETRNSNH